MRKKKNDIVSLILKDSGFGGDPNRPYTGQPWTFHGERGQGNVPPMTYRDLGDLVVEALSAYCQTCIKVEGSAPSFDKMDYNALTQMVLLKVEEATGEERWRKFTSAGNETKH